MKFKISDGDEVRHLYKKAVKNYNDNSKRRQQEIDNEQKKVFDKYYPALLKIITKLANDRKTYLYVYYARNDIVNLDDPIALFVPRYFANFFKQKGFIVDQLKKGDHTDGFYIRWYTFVRYDD